MTTGFFIRTFDRDIGWLKLCLQSICHYGEPSNTIIVTDKDCLQVQAEAARLGFTCKISDSFVENGYIRQQRDKLCADKYLAAYDSICYVDSDTRLVSQSQDVSGSKIPFYVQDWRGDMLWRSSCNYCIGAKVLYEYDNAPVYYSKPELLRDFRQFIRKRFCMDFEDYMCSQYVFSEYTVLGEFCRLFHPEEVELIWTSYEGPFVKEWAFDKETFSKLCK